MRTKQLVIKGRTIEEIIKDEEHLAFKLDTDEVFILHHVQECCEYVSIEQIDGDLDDLIGAPLLMAEEIIDGREHGWGSITWTFYKFATCKGYVTVRWKGESNGYYSESVDKGLTRNYDEFTIEDILKGLK